MPLLGSAALAMWWDIAPQVLADFEDWHSHEHFTERLGIPGFHRATRWRDAGVHDLRVRNRDRKPSFVCDE